MLSLGESLNKDQKVRTGPSEPRSRLCSSHPGCSAGSRGQVPRGDPQPGVCSRTAQNPGQPDPERKSGSVRSIGPAGVRVYLVSF